MSDAASPRVEIIHPDFRAILRPDTRIEPIAQGLKFTEGPAWFDQGQCLIFSDIPGDTMYRWTAGAGHEVFRRPSRNANGNTVDLQGRLLTCEHGSRQLTRTEPDGSVTVLAATFGRRRLNSPNDVIVQRDGTIWFTDPPYGINPKLSEQPHNYVFRLDPGATEPVAVAADFSRPNGLCFSPDERWLYVADSDTSIHHVRRFAVGPDKALAGGEVFVTIDPGLPDGIRVDADGRLFSTAADGVHVFSPRRTARQAAHPPDRRQLPVRRPRPRDALHRRHQHRLGRPPGRAGRALARPAAWPSRGDAEWNCGLGGCTPRSPYSGLKGRQDFAGGVSPRTNMSLIISQPWKGGRNDEPDAPTRQTQSPPFCRPSGASCKKSRLPGAYAPGKIRRTLRG